MKKLLLSLGTVAAVVTPVVAVVSCSVVDKAKAKLKEEEAKHPGLQSAVDKVNELADKAKDKMHELGQDIKKKIQEEKDKHPELAAKVANFEDKVRGFAYKVSDKTKAEFAKLKADALGFFANIKTKFKDAESKMQDEAKKLKTSAIIKYNDVKAGAHGVVVTLDETASTATFAFEENVVNLQKGLNKLPEALDAAIADLLAKTKGKNISDVTITLTGTTLKSLDVKVSVAGDDVATIGTSVAETIIDAADKNADNKNWATKLDGAGDTVKIPQSTGEAAAMGADVINGLSFTDTQKKTWIDKLNGASTIEETYDIVNQALKVN